jgi:hypothetical protein
MLKRTRALAVAAIAAVAAVSLAGTASAAPGDPITVSGYVTDADGNPLAWQSVQVYGGTNYLGFTNTDFNGYYEITGTSNTEVETLQVSAWGALCEPLAPFSAPAVLTSNCQVPAKWTVTVSGTVSADDGSPTEGTWLSFEGDLGGFANATVGEDGAYEATFEVYEGTSEIYVRTSYDLGTPAATITGVSDGAVFTGVDFTYHVIVIEYVDYVIAGTVTDKKGRPAADAEIQVELEGTGEIFAALTQADGTYVLSYPGFWTPEYNAKQTAWLSVNGALAEFIGDPDPYGPTTVDYRIGKSPSFEPFAMGLELTVWGSITDIYRKAGNDGVADWRVCTDGYCYGDEFGSKRTSLFEITPPHNGSGTAYVMLRERNRTTHEWDWWRLGPDWGYDQSVSFGFKSFDGTAYEDIFGYGMESFIGWADRGGDTHMWIWGVGESSELIEHVIAGKFVAIAFEDLNAADGPEMIVTTRKGNKHSVYLIEDPTSEPELVATGNGVPNVSYDDTDSDGVLDVVVTYP